MRIHGFEGSKSIDLHRIGVIRNHKSETIFLYDSTKLQQPFAKGLVPHDSELEEIPPALERLRRSLLHGHLYTALQKIDDSSRCPIT